MTAQLKVAAKPIAPEKLQEIMLKIRKGATSSLTWAQIGAVLEALGGSLKPIIGAVSTRSEKSQYPERVDGETLEEVLARAKHLDKYRVNSIPSNPKAGMLYVTDISPPATYPSGYHHVDYVAYVGVSGFHLTLGTDETDILPDAYDVQDVARTLLEKGTLGTPRKLQNYEALDWLNKHDWKSAVSAYMNMEEHVPAAARTRDGTGSCPVCFSNVKIQGDRIVLHGYRRPGTGETHGRCIGVGYPPFELSVEGTEHYLEKDLKPTLAKRKSILNSLQAADLETLVVGQGRTINKGDPSWDYQLSMAIENVKNQVKHYETEISVFTLLVNHWVERPLPKEGEKHHNWYIEGRVQRRMATRVASAFLSPSIVAARFFNR